MPPKKSSASPTSATPTSRSSSTRASPVLARASSKTHRLTRAEQSSSSRGRPRKEPKPVPLTLEQQVRRVKQHALFWPAVGLALALLGALVWKALDIASHANSTFPDPNELASNLRSASSSLKARASSYRRPIGSPSSPSSAVSSSERPLDERVEEAVREALEDAWNLEQVEPAPGSAQAVKESAKVAASEIVAEEEPPRQRTLAELYADMDALGLNTDQLNEMLHDAQRG